MVPATRSPPNHPLTTQRSHMNAITRSLDFGWKTILFLGITIVILTGDAWAQRIKTFQLNTPLIEEVTFCSSQTAIEHIITTVEKKGDTAASQLVVLYGNAGICGKVYGAITYTAFVGKIGKLRIYKGEMASIVFYVATEMSHDEI